MKILLLLIGIDYFTGIAKAIVHKKLNSTTARNGFITKAVMLLLVVAVRYAYPDGYTLACIYYTLNELLSIIENAIGLGIPVPKQIKEVMEKWNTTK